ncbi:hypothetical protein EJ110_NYTH55035 [Nymphaea thermarum]|nr:hypothetical protein EJ110_NYTH55035 [Nymphaea thermarum]
MADAARDEASKGAKSTEHNTLKITSTPLNGANYLSWVKAARLFLSGKSKAGYINGKIKVPVTTDPNYDEWKSENDMVMVWLLNSMEPSIANLFTYQDTAHRIWEALNELYSEQINLARVYQIQCEIVNLTLHDQDGEANNRNSTENSVDDIPRPLADIFARQMPTCQPGTFHFPSDDNSLESTILEEGELTTNVEPQPA